MVTCAWKICVYAVFVGVFLCVHSVAASAKDEKESKGLIVEKTTTGISVPVDQFQWNEHNKLSWSDFRGEVKAANDESAAATHCGIGFRTGVNVPGKKPEVTVYNTFYANKSWVRKDAKISSILTHEQGHFDLCEIYTRKLRNRMTNFDFNVSDVKQALLAIYSEISSEYESRQQAYERETTHGTNLEQQKRWSDAIAGELINS
jgi:uncharacterized protein DUF922